MMVLVAIMIVTLFAQDGNGGYVVHGMENVTSIIDTITILSDN